MPPMQTQWGPIMKLLHQPGLLLALLLSLACAQGLAHFGAGFAHARKDHLARIAACGQHAVEFTA